MWEAKTKYYLEIIHHFSEISTYSSSLAARSMPIGDTITDKHENDMASTIFHSITNMRKSRNVYAIFVSKRSIESIDRYLEKALSHQFDMGEEHGMWHEGDWLAEMDFETRSWGGHHDLAMEAINDITSEAKKDLNNNPMLKLFSMTKTISYKTIHSLISNSRGEK